MENNNNNPLLTPKETAISILSGLTKCVLTSIPLLIPIMNIWDEIQSKKIHKSLENVNKKIVSLKEEKLDRTYIESDEFCILCYLIIKKIKESASQYKINFFEELLVTEMTKDRYPDLENEYKESFIQIIASLTICEMELLKDFSIGKYSGKERVDIYSNDDENLNIAFDGLMAKGLIREGGTWNQDVILTFLGSKLIKFIKHNSNKNINN